MLMFAVLLSGSIGMSVYYGFLVTKLGMFIYYQLSLQSWLFAMLHLKSYLTATQDQSFSSFKTYSTMLWLIICVFTIMNIVSLVMQIY